MTDLFQVYNLNTKGRDITAILKDYQEKHGVPPQVVHVNKVDSGSELPEGLKMVLDRWVLPKHFYLEIAEVEDEA